MNWKKMSWKDRLITAVVVAFVCFWMAVCVFLAALVQGK